MRRRACVYQQTSQNIAPVIKNLSVFNISATCTDAVPATWKAANISALYKRDDETDKRTYRPISLISVLGKLMASIVASTIRGDFVLNNIFTNGAPSLAAPN